MSLDPQLDTEIAVKKIKDIDRAIELIGELEPSKQSNSEYAEHFDIVVTYLEDLKQKIQSGDW